VNLRREFIATDGMQLYNHLRHRCTEEEVHDIVREAVVIEKEFLTDALPCALIGINAGVSLTSVYWRLADMKKMMCEYIEFVADRLVVTLGSRTYPNCISVLMCIHRLS
jgi:ribonucleoside-diphosphate reductase subunit M2